MRVLKAMIFLLVLTLTGMAQSDNTSKLVGTVYDHFGAVIPNVKVVATSPKGKKFEAFTNEEGLFMLNLSYFPETPYTKMMKYEIAVDMTASGFKKFVIKDYSFVQSTLGKMCLDIALEVQDGHVDVYPISPKKIQKH